MEKYQDSMKFYLINYLHLYKFLNDLEVFKIIVY